eukprot:scaffold143_cov260-Pinguiococcus_pyrenoidosus.AAC.55
MEPMASAQLGNENPLLRAISPRAERNSALEFEATFQICFSRDKSGRLTSCSVGLCASNGGGSVKHRLEKCACDGCLNAFVAF